MYTLVLNLRLTNILSEDTEFKMMMIKNDDAKARYKSILPSIGFLISSCAKTKGVTAAIAKEMMNFDILNKKLRKKKNNTWELCTPQKKV